MTVFFMSGFIYFHFFRPSPHFLSTLYYRATFFVIRRASFALRFNNPFRGYFIQANLLGLFASLLTRTPNPLWLSCRQLARQRRGMKQHNASHLYPYPGKIRSYTQQQKGNKHEQTKERNPAKEGTSDNTATDRRTVSGHHD